MARCTLSVVSRPRRLAVSCPGQALVETCIALIVLVPLLLFAWLLADLNALQHAAIAATRQTALETFHREPLELEAINVAHLQPFAHLIDAADLLVEGTAQPEVVTTYERLAFLALEPAKLVGAGDFDLAQDSALRASVSIRLRPAALLPRWLELPELTLQEHMSLMHDDWDAASSEQVRLRTAALSAAGRLNEWKSILAPVSWALSFLEPAFEKLCLGRIDPEIVPADRLSADATQQSDLRKQACD